jgi:hypothetical protein
LRICPSPLLKWHDKSQKQIFGYRFFCKSESIALG